MITQRTLKTLIRAVGLGMHSGQRVEMTLRPAAVNTGIVFRRIDLVEPVEIACHALAVSDTRMASTISHKGVRVQTIEHLMSALSGLGIDNLYVDLTAEEVPILDGSAASFVFLLQNAGIVEQAQPRQFIRVTQTVEVSEGAGEDLKWARLVPYEGYRLSFEIRFGHPALDASGQDADFDLAQQDYSRVIARARTFGFTRDVEMLRARGLAMGGGLDNAIVMDDYRILNSDGLRYDDEFARHKILDAMGDLYILGKPLLAHYQAFRSGHALNNLLLRKLLDENAYETVQFDERKTAPQAYAQPILAW